MKRILSYLMLCSTTALAADSTIGNLTPITTVPDAYRMPWENPGVLDYYITFQNLTNQVLAGMASQSYANSVTNGLLSTGSAAATYMPYSLTTLTNKAYSTNLSGILPAGTVAANNMTNGLALGTDGSNRVWTNFLAGVSIGGNATSSTSSTTATNAPDGLPILSTNSSILYVNTNGDDSTAIKGSRPWQTLKAAITNAVSGDVIHLGVGTFSVGNQIILPSNISVIGSGMFNSTVSFVPVNNKAGVVPGDNVLLADLGITQSIWSGAGAAGTQYPIGLSGGDSSTYHFTNVILDHVYIAGETDGIYFNVASGFTNSITINNSTLFGHWDVVAAFGAGVSNTTITVNNTSMVINNQGTTNSLTQTTGAASFLNNGGSGATITYNNCFGRMNLGPTNSTTSQTWAPRGRLVNKASTATGSGCVRMNNCAFDFTSTVFTNQSLAYFYPRLYWPCATSLHDTNASGGVSPGLYVGYGSGNDAVSALTNVYFNGVVCTYSNISVTFYVGGPINNTAYLDDSGVTIGGSSTSSTTATNDSLSRNISTTYAPLSGTNTFTGSMTVSNNLFISSGLPLLKFGTGANAYRTLGMGGDSQTYVFSNPWDHNPPALFSIGRYGDCIVSGLLTITNGVISGASWAGATNAAPVNAVTPVAWYNYTNAGLVFKVPLYQ